MEFRKPSETTLRLIRVLMNMREAQASEFLALLERAGTKSKF